MASTAKTPQEYLDQLPEDRKKAMTQLRKTILKHLPEGFTETLSYGMLGYVVPLETYPNGYQCNPIVPLPFLSLASQKNYIALYHSGLYANKELYDWFVKEYPKHVTHKLDMGKSCVRFKKTEQIPYPLIAELLTKMTPQEWIKTYESVVKK